MCPEHSVCGHARARARRQDALLEGLPVVRVRDWASLTPRWLHEEWERIQRGTSEGRLTWTKLYLPYWLHAFTAHIRPDLA